MIDPSKSSSKKLLAKVEVNPFLAYPIDLRSVRQPVLRRA